MQHFFDIDIATKYGILEAILLNNFYFWLSHNKANEVHFINDKYWTFNSARAFSEMFPYVSQSTIQRAISHLEKEGLIEIGEFNERSFDRTKWYALTDKGWLLFQNDKLDWSKWVMDVGQNDQTIPDNNPIYINTNTNNKYIVEQVINHLNEKTSSNYKTTSKKTQSLINARLKEGFSVDDFIKVIDTKTADWIKKPDMRQYLRPETLFGTKFESYLNQKPSATGNKVSDKWGI